MYIPNIYCEKINLEEQQACTVVQLPYFAENGFFCTPIIVNIFITPPFDPKTFVIQRIKNHLKTL